VCGVTDECVRGFGCDFSFSVIAKGFRSSSNLWHGSLDLDRFGLVLSRVVRSKEDLKEDWELDEEQEEGVFWNALDRLKDLRIKVC
jgi:hypothetical protein